MISTSFQCWIQMELLRAILEPVTVERILIDSSTNSTSIFIQKFLLWINLPILSRKNTRLDCNFILIFMDIPRKRIFSAMDLNIRNQMIDTLNAELLPKLSRKWTVFSATESQFFRSVNIKRQLQGLTCYGILKYPCHILLKYLMVFMIQKL